jgi:hypothetical protein
VIFVALVDHAKIVGRLIRAMHYDYSTLALLEVFIAGSISSKPTSAGPPNRSPSDWPIVSASPRPSAWEFGQALSLEQAIDYALNDIA